MYKYIGESSLRCRIWQRDFSLLRLGGISMRKLVIGGLYRHFKGMYYYVKDVAIHSETGDRFVVYQKLYDDRGTYIRPYDMFLSDVDREKYPDVEQVERFKLMSGRD